MLGAGVFVVFRDSYAIAQGQIFIALALAALVATLNASSVYRLAKEVERPGGVYAYSRVYLNDSLSFASGFAFVFGKIGSIGAIALVFQEYVLPNQPFWPAALAICVLALINILGINRTAAVAGVLSTVTIAFLVFVIAKGLQNPLDLAPALSTEQVDLFSVLQAASVLFFAFAGYARVATLGNEVRNPKRNIPLAILIALTVVIALYGLLEVVLLGTLGRHLATVSTPLANVSGVPLLATLVAAAASLGSMLALLAGVSRTAAVMSEDRELPAVFASRNRFGSPWLAEVVIAAGAIALTAVGDLRWVIGFSSFSVLFYYSVGHLSALRQGKPSVTQKIIAVAGLLLCTALAVSVPGPALPISVAIVAGALVVRRLVRR
jgi:APA family basic amino acid/polyamine antiporter